MDFKSKARAQQLNVYERTPSNSYQLVGLWWTRTVGRASTRLSNNRVENFS